MGRKFWRRRSENGCDVFYEASVAGGIPIIRTLIEGFSSDRITKIMGIVNGTTNYILTKMSQEGAAYGDVLKEAQELGYAEADPTSDVEGLGCRPQNDDSGDARLPCECGARGCRRQRHLRRYARRIFCMRRGWAMK